MKSAHLQCGEVVLQCFLVLQFDMLLANVSQSASNLKKVPCVGSVASGSSEPSQNIMQVLSVAPGRSEPHKSTHVEKYFSFRCQCDIACNLARRDIGMNPLADVKPDPATHFSMHVKISGHIRHSFSLLVSENSLGGNGC